MKILLVTAGYLPDGLGGVELSLARFASWAIGEGHEILVFRRLGLADVEEFALLESDVDGVRVVGVNYRFGDATTFRHLLHNPTIRARFETVLRGFAPDVVHVHHLTCLTTEIVDASQEAGVPVVLSLHDFWMGCPRGQRIRNDLSPCPDIEVGRCTRCFAETWPHWFPAQRDAELERRTFDEYHVRIREVLDRADALIVPSPFARTVFARYSVPAQRLEVLEYGMDPRPYRDLTREPSDRLRIGYLGSVLPSKGVHVLIEAFQRLDSSSACLEIHGPILPFHQDHGYGERLRELTRGWESRITFHGAYGPDRTPAILCGLDVLVVPSLWYETYCMVIREGFLAGVPVVASDYGAMAAGIDHDRTGLLFAVGDSADLAAKLDRLAHDPELRGRLAASDKHISTVDENSARTLSIYERLTKN